MADEALDLLRQELALHREESRTYLDAMREENRIYFERLDASARESREESAAPRQGFLSVIDELRRHGLGGAPA